MTPNKLFHTNKSIPSLARKATAAMYVPSISKDSGANMHAHPTRQISLKLPAPIMTQPSRVTFKTLQLQLRPKLDAICSAVVKESVSLLQSVPWELQLAFWSSKATMLIAKDFNSFPQYLPRTWTNHWHFLTPSIQLNANHWQHAIQKYPGSFMDSHLLKIAHVTPVTLPVIPTQVSFIQNPQSLKVLIGFWSGQLI